MNRQELKTLLSGEDSVSVTKFINHVTKLDTEKNKDGTTKNGWMGKVPNEKLVELYQKVAKEGLVFDGVHITLGINGIQYDYIAYKNRMLLAYPESIIDAQLVYKGDEFSFSKESGVVSYKHVFTNPFDQKDEDIIGAYCVIKNKRGEFLTTLSAKDIDKHRKVAKTDFIWKAWFKEMCLKTVYKKATKVHFDDIYAEMDDEDNKNSDPDQIIEIPKNKEKIDEIRAKVAVINTQEELVAYYESLEVRTKAITDIFTERKTELKSVTA